MSLFNNVAAELIAGAIIALAALVLPLLWFYFLEYRLLLKFFGLTPAKRTLILYLSSLNIAIGGAVDAKGIARTYTGVALPDYEYQLIPPFTQLFGTLRERLFYAFARLIGSRYWAMKLSFEVKASPQSAHNIDFENIVSVGSAGYNEVTAYYHRTAGPYLELDVNALPPVLRIRKGAQAGTMMPNPNGDDLAILERTHDATHGTMVFVAAGLGVNGTRGAAEYLFRNWRALQREYGDEDFAWCLSFPFINAAPNGWQQPTILRRFPR